MPDANATVVNRMIEEIQNRNNLALVDELFSADFLNHTPLPGIPNDRHGMRQLFSMTHDAFPDGVIAVEDQASSGSKVWTRKVFTGTHTGPLRGLAPTGRVVTYRVYDVLEIRDARIIAHWGLADQLALLRQLGAIGEPSR